MPVIPSRSADDSGTGAPAPDIGVTPEMIEAGVKELGQFDFRFGRRTEAVERIFTAMWSARKAAQSS
jgi:hypothetical protein